MKVSLEEFKRRMPAKPTALSTIIVALREREGHTQVFAAKALGMARQTYLDMETGRREPRYSTIVNMSRLWHEPISTFFPNETQNKLRKQLSDRLLTLDDERLSLVVKLLGL